MNELVQGQFYPLVKGGTRCRWNSSHGALQVVNDRQQLSNEAVFELACSVFIFSDGALFEIVEISRKSQVIFAQLSEFECSNLPLGFFVVRGLTKRIGRSAEGLKHWR